MLILTLCFVFVILYKSHQEAAKIYQDIAHQAQRGTEDPLSMQYAENLDYVDPFQSLLIRKSETVPGLHRGRCPQRNNFVFIKTMKCATQTVVQILRRFGYLRNLNFVLPRDNNIYLGWPFQMDRLDYRPSRRPFNSLVEHSVYNSSVFSQLMPKDTAYVTIIREPFSHFKSTFNYFNIANITFVKEEDKVSGYLQNLDKYETFYKSPDGAKIRYCIPDGFSVTKNLLSHCLGMPLGFPAGSENITSNAVKVTQYIGKLDKEFDLVMIMEYFHESLVLLKRLMCWSMADILYRMSNVGSYTFKSSPPNDLNLKIYKHWSHVDYLLYDHFNKTFWRKVYEQGEDFHREVAEYNQIQSEVTKFCSDPTRENVLTIDESEFTESFHVNRDFCLILGLDLLDYLKRRYDREEKWTEPEEEKSLRKKTC